jgi:hypothetical protein
MEWEAVPTISRLCVVAGLIAGSVAAPASAQETNSASPHDLRGATSAAERSLPQLQDEEIIERRALRNLLSQEEVDAEAVGKCFGRIVEIRLRRLQATAQFLARTKEYVQPGVPGMVAKAMIPRPPIVQTPGGSGGAGAGGLTGGVPVCQTTGGDYIVSVCSYPESDWWYFVWRDGSRYGFEDQGLPLAPIP